MDVVITGSSGLIGTALIEALTDAGHRAIPMVRAKATSGQLAWDPRAGKIDANGLEGVDAVVHLAGAGIGDKRWTDAYRKELVDSRTIPTALLANTLATLVDPPKVLLSGSAIGIYGDRGNETLTETSPRGTGFLSQLVVDWEAAAQPAVDAGIRTALLRTGIVQSTKGGALKKQLPLFKLGLGGKFGKGDNWQSWISITDQVGAILHLLSNDVSGPVNLTAPTPVTQGQYVKALGKALHRPAFAIIPPFAPKLLLGGELVDALLLEGQKVLPTVLQASGYAFVHPTIDLALKALLAR
jgi:uncharacterized protein